MAVKKKLDAKPRRRKRPKVSRFGASCPPKPPRHKASKPGGK
jgi:hypothetical protein